MADLLAANALLVATLTILYTLWYPQIEAGIEIAVRKNEQADHAGNFKRYKSVFVWKALPVALGSIVLVVINVPDCFEIVSFALSQIQSHPRANYDAAKATYVVVTLIMAFLAGHSVRSAFLLGLNVLKMKPRSM